MDQVNFFILLLKKASKSKKTTLINKDMLLTVVNKVYLKILILLGKKNNFKRKG